MDVSSPRRRRHLGPRHGCISTSTDATEAQGQIIQGALSGHLGEQQDWEKAVKGDGSQTIYLVSQGFQHRFWQGREGGARAKRLAGWATRSVLSARG